MKDFNISALQNLFCSVHRRYQMVMVRCFVQSVNSVLLAGNSDDSMSFELVHIIAENHYQLKLEA